jgi:hypothetical protein
MQSPDPKRDLSRRSSRQMIPGAEVSRPRSGAYSRTGPDLTFLDPKLLLSKDYGRTPSEL